MSDIRSTDSGEADTEGLSAPRANLWRPFLLVLFVGLIAIVVRLSGGAGWIDLQRITALLEPIGSSWWAPLAAAGLYIVFNLLGLPGSVLTVASGVVWGWLAGGTIALLGSTIGTAAPYLLARTHAPVFGAGIRRRAAWLHRLLEREGFTALLMLRLLPSLPYAVINYAAGFAGIPPRPYFLATLLGTIPGVFVTTWLASAIFSGEISLGGAFLRIAIAGGIIGSIVLSARAFARSRQRPLS